MSGSCGYIKTTYAVDQGMLSEFPGLNSIGEGEPVMVSTGRKPMDGTVMLVKCEKGKRKRCNMLMINAGSFADASKFISKYFPGEQGEAKPEVTGEYPDNCLSLGRRFVAYCIAYTNQTVSNLAKQLDIDDQEFLEKFTKESYIAPTESYVSSVDITTMGIEDLKRYHRILIQLSDIAPPAWMDDKAKQMFKIAKDEIVAIIVKKQPK